jgi:hypothetical protein
VSLVETIFDGCETELRYLGCCLYGYQNHPSVVRPAERALKRKKLARPGFEGIATRAPNPFSEEAERLLAWMVQGSIEDRQAVFLQEKIVGHATVGNDELRCTGGADEITTSVKTTTGGSGW